VKGEEDEERKRSWRRTHPSSPTVSRT